MKDIDRAIRAVLEQLRRNNPEEWLSIPQAKLRLDKLYLDKYSIFIPKMGKSK